jgi:hypothetical protein
MDIEHPPTAVALSLAVAVAVVGALSLVEVLPRSLAVELLLSSAIVTVVFAVVYRVWLSDVDDL